MGLKESVGIEEWCHTSGDGSALFINSYRLRALMWLRASRYNWKGTQESAFPRQRLSSEQSLSGNPTAAHWMGRDRSAKIFPSFMTQYFVCECGYFTDVCEKCISCTLMYRCCRRVCDVVPLHGGVRRRAWPVVLRLLCPPLPRTTTTLGLHRLRRYR